MKHTYFLLPILAVALLFAGQLKAQISEGGLPVSFNYPNTLKSDPGTVQVPVNFSVEDLKTVDAWQVSQGAPLKVATFIPVKLSIENSGEWRTLPDGTKTWQLRIQAKGAVALMLCYNDFYIPAGGRLFIYNTDKTQVLGAYTYQTNPPVKKFATEFIAGDDIVLEYEAASEGDNPLIEIEKVGYGYNYLDALVPRANAGPGGSAPCMVNVNCEEGEEWQQEKSGICEMILVIGQYGYYCSGSLVNNTAQDEKPYILSASHCIDIDEEVSQADLDQYLFYFHFERIGCDNESPSYRPYTMTGCTRVASTPLDKGSDGLLLLLNQTIPDNYNVYFNGWDRSNTTPLSGVGLHHPNGDYMKISTFGKIRTKTTTWYGENSTIGTTGAHWNVIYDETTNGHAVTEGGSSGSPIFNQNKLIVGTLSGGNSSCDDPDDSNLYGKLYHHWDKHSRSDNKRMDRWLDPLGTGALTLPGKYQSQAPTASETIDRLPSGDQVSFYPLTFEDQISITNHNRVKQMEIISMNGTIVGKIMYPEAVVSTSALPTGVYIFRFYTDSGIQTIRAIRK